MSSSMSRRSFIALGAVAGAGALLSSNSAYSLVNPEDLSAAEYADLQNRVNTAAAANEDVLLGVFFTNDADQTVTLYGSLDGRQFVKLSVPYQCEPEGYGTLVNSRGYDSSPHDPSMIAKDGCFYMLGGWSRRDGRLWPRYGASKDLLHWTYPNADHLNVGNQYGTESGVRVDEYPMLNGQIFDGGQENSPNGFGTVTPDWVVDDDGSVWVLFNCGYYHGLHDTSLGDDPRDDRLCPYIFHLTEFHIDGDIREVHNNSDTMGYSCNLTAIVDNDNTARKVRLPLHYTYNDGFWYSNTDDGEWNEIAGYQQNVDNIANDRIDGSLFIDNGKHYLIITRNTCINEIWCIDNFANCGNPDAWRRVNANAFEGFEGPCITKFKGRYWAYCDSLRGRFLRKDGDKYWNNYAGDYAGYEEFPGTDARGIRCTSCDDIESPYMWDDPVYLNISNSPGCNANNSTRHGSVIAVTDEACKAQVWSTFAAALNDVRYAFADMWQKYSEHAAWYVSDENIQYIQYAYDTGIMGGYTKNHPLDPLNFGPEDNVTRGQIVTILYRYATGNTAATTDNNVGSAFVDVNEGDFFAAAVNWANENGIVTGYKNPDGTYTHFGPYDNVKREDLATMIGRFAGWKETGTAKPPAADASNFNALRGTTPSPVDSWATEGMKWCTAHGVIGGKGGTDMAPLDPAQRCEVAKIITVTVRDVL